MFKSLISSPRRRQFFNLLIFYAVYLWFRSFSGSVLGPHFLQQSVSFKQMILGSGWFFLAGALLLVTLRKFSSRSAWRWAIILAFIAILVIIKIDYLWQFYLFNILLGLNVMLFFVPYNIAHFQLTPSTRTSYSAAILFSIYPLISLISPLLAGWLAEISYNYIWIFSAVFFLIAFSFVKSQTQLVVSLSLKPDWVYLKPTRIFVLLQGLWEAVVFGAIPVFTLYFIQTPLYYGTYLSYLALVAILANLFLGQLSDKLRHRLRFLYSVSLALALVTLIFPLALNSLKLWLVLTAVVQFLVPLFWNFSTAFFVDLQPDLPRAMPVRELLLAVGRTGGFLLIFVNFYLQPRPTYVFYLLGLVMFLYPLLLWRYRRQLSIVV